MTPEQLPDVVFAFAYETWADAVERDMSWSADRMVERLLVEPLIASLLVVNPWRSRVTRWRRRRGSVTKGFPFTPGRELLRPYRWRRRDARGVAANVRAYRALDQWVIRRAKARGLTRPVLVTCHPMHAAVADSGYWADVVYFGWDDWAAHPPFARQHKALRWAYERMGERQARVCAVSQAIVDRIGSPRSLVVPNAINPDDFDNAPEVPAWFAQLPRPMALYAGSLEQRVDADAIRDAALALPDWSFVLVGHAVEPRPFTALAQLPNVTLKSLHPRREVLAMMASADVCLIPHRKTPMTEAMSPLKLYEYLGAGASVVATDLSPIRGISDRCILLPPGSPLAPAILLAAEAPRLGPQELAAWRHDNDWDARYLDWRRFALGPEVEAMRSA